MPEPLRSPKQSRVAAKNRSHPYSRPASTHRTRDVGLTRSNSILGTIKSIVTAPLSWLSSSDSQEPNESPQKRRVSGSERGGTPPTAKRARRESPEVAGYLDPPSSLFQTTRPPIPIRDNANGVAFSRTMSIDLPPPSPVDVHSPPSRGHSILSRTSMSVEPHAPSVRRSMTRELSMPPPSPFARSYSRSSLTPQPSGATFGPSPKRKLRELTAPPLLPSTATTPMPTFTRPQPSSTRKPALFPQASSREISEGPISVLLGRNRQSMSPVRESPSRKLLVRDDAIETRSFSKGNPERTLSALESYRTPLHLARFPSAAPTDEHRPRKVHVPIPSKMRFDHTPDGRKAKAKRGPTVVGPYSSGMSGMRKLLAKQREELERDANFEMETPEQSYELDVDDDEEVPKSKGKDKDDEEVEARKPHSQVNGVTAKADVQLPRTRSPPRSKPDGPYSSLRAPSNRVSRTHAPAPRLKKVRNKFSLNDDDDMEWSMSVEDVKNYQANAAQAQSPISFSPIRRMSETGMQTDTGDVSLARAKTPPLPSQPQTFDSLLSRIGSPSSIPTKEAAAFPAAPASPPKPDNHELFQPKENAETNSARATLPFSLGTTTTKSADVGISSFASNVTPSLSSSPNPAPPASAFETGGVPSFFSNTKSHFTPPKVPSGSLFEGTSSSNEKNISEERSKNVFGGFSDAGKEVKSDQKDMQKETKPSPFGSVSKPSTFGSQSTSVFGGDGSKTAFSGDSLKPVTASNSTTANTMSPFGGFGGTKDSDSDDAPRAAFQFGVSAKDGSTSTSNVNIFGAANKPDGGFSTSSTDASSKSAFSFPAAPQSSTPSAEKSNTNTEAPAADTPSKRAFSFDAQPSKPTTSVEVPKSQFSFGTPASAQSSNAAPEASKTPFSFGAAPSTPPPADKKSSFMFGNLSSGGAPAFSFGSNTLSTTGATNGTTETPKLVFTGFGNPSAPTAQKASTPPDSGDGMEVNGGDRMEESPTRTVDKKEVPASQLAQLRSFSGFGASSVGSSGGLSFGEEKPPSSTGSFSFGDPKPSTGSGFGFGQTANKSTMGANLSSGFSFGGNSNKSTTAPISTGFSFGGNSNKSTTAPISTGFSFGGDSNKSTTVPTSTGFTFGNNSPKPEVQPQLSFGAPVNSPFGSGSTQNATTTSQSFQFGQPNSTTNANPFGQQNQPDNGNSSAPSSPSLFAQQTAQASQPQSPSFSFNVPPATSFSSSNTGQSTNAAPQPFQFGAPSTQEQQPGAAGGNTMFTLGGAATPRKVKGLPSRRARRP